MFHFIPTFYEDSVQNALILGVIFHFLYFMLMWALIRSIISDPGKVPIYWGLFWTTQNQRKEDIV